MTIDIHALLEKNPTTKKLLQPKFGYKYLGPYNDLEDQLSYNKNTGQIYKYYDEPKNNLDEIASRHDTCYSIGENKNKCDIIIVNKINDIPYNQRPWGTFEIKKLLIQNKNLVWELKMITNNHIDEIFAADLVEMQNFSKINKGYRYLLPCIDIFSKYAFVIPLKDKKGITIKNALQKIFNKRKPKFLWTDNGKEFYNNQVNDLLEKNSIKLYSTNSSEIKSSVIERFNRTFKNMMYKKFTENNNKIFYNIIDKLVNEYNIKYHRTIKMTPIEASRRLMKRK